VVAVLLVSLPLLPGHGGSGHANPPNPSSSPSATGTAATTLPPTLRAVSHGQLRLGECGAIIFETGKPANGSTGPFDIRWNCMPADGMVGIWNNALEGFAYFGKVPFESIDENTLRFSRYNFRGTGVRQSTDPHVYLGEFGSLAILDKNGGLAPGVVFGAKGWRSKDGQAIWIKVQVVARSMPNLTLKWTVYEALPGYPA